MHVRKLGATVGTVLFLAAAGLTQAASPAVAAPSGTAVSSDFRDFQKGYRAGFRDGWKMARDDCEKMQNFAFKLNDDETDYMRGYDKGFDRGFEKGFWEYCD